MRLPEHVKIGAHYFEVKECDLKDEETIGLCKHKLTQIFIQEGLSESRQTEVLMHECLHAVSDFMGAKLSERQVEQMGEGVLMLLNDNPNIKWNVGPVNI